MDLLQMAGSSLGGLTALYLGALLVCGYAGFLWFGLGA